MLTIEGGPSSTLRMTPVLKDSYEVSIFNLKFDIVVFRDYSRNIGNSPFNATKGSRTARTGRGSNPIYDSVSPEHQNCVDLKVTRLKLSGTDTTYSAQESIQCSPTEDEQVPIDHQEHGV